MAFTTKQFNDLRGILFLMLLTIPSIATTNIDCNGKPFHCVNSTHFMICVDLGSGVSSTIDSFIIPCPAPTECHGTNRFECEFSAAITEPPTNEPLAIAADQTTIAPIQASESTIQFVPEIITTIPIEDLYNAASTTLSVSELSIPNIIDSTTIYVFDNANVSTSGSHADLEVGGRNIDVLNITSSTQDVMSETVVSSVITDSAVANTTENAIIFTQISEITTVIPDVGITMTEQNKIRNFSTTETLSLITENVSETNVNSISVKQLVTGNINLSNSIQNQLGPTTESLKSDTQVDNNTASTTEIISDQSIVTNAPDSIRIEKASESTVTVKNPLENVLLNAENIITTTSNVPKENIVTDDVVKQTTQIYATTETLVASSMIIPSDLSISTESIILVEPNNLIENKVIIDQEKQRASVDRGTIEKTLGPLPKTDIEMFTQNATSTNNLGNMATPSINDSNVITGPSSELHTAVLSSTTPTIDTTLNTETTIIITQDEFNSIKNTTLTSTSEVSVTTDTVIANDNNNLVYNISITSLQSTYSPTFTADEKIVSTVSTNAETTQNQIEVSTLETNLRTSSENLLTLVTTEKIFQLNPTVIEPAVSESNTNFVSNVLDSKPSKLDPAAPQLEVFNKHDKDVNVSNVNLQNNIFSHRDLNADNQDIKSETITTESTSTETVKSIGNSDVNKRIQLGHHSITTPQRENGTPKIKTTESSINIVSDGNAIFEPSVTSLPVLPAESFLYQEAHTPENATTDQIVIETTTAGDNQLNTQNYEKIDLMTNIGSSILPTEAIGQLNDVTELNRKVEQLYTSSETNKITDPPNEKAPDYNTEKIISELPKIEPIRHEMASKNDHIKIQLQNRVDTNILQEITTDAAISYSPTITADDKLVSIESIILENEQNIIKPTVVETTSSKNQQTLATKESILEINRTVTDSAVSESNLFLESNNNVQLPKTQLTKAIDINNKHYPTAPEMGLEESYKAEPKGYETSMAPMTVTQTNPRKIEFNTQQQKVTKIISGITSSVAEHTITKLPESTLKNAGFAIPTPTAVPESIWKVADFNVPSQTVVPESIRIIVDFDVPTQTAVPESIRKTADFDLSTQTSVPESIRKIADFDVPTQTAVPESIRKTANFDLPTQTVVPESIRKIADFDVPSKTAVPDSILQLTTFSWLKNTEKINSASILDSIDSTKKRIIETHSDFIKTQDDNTKYYSTGDITTKIIPTMSLSENLDTKIQDGLQKMAFPQNQIVIPIVNSLENIQYSSNNKLSEALTTLQTQTEQITTELKLASQQNSEKIHENPQDNTNTVANIANNSVTMPINSKKLSFTSENIDKPNILETSVPISEKAVINLTPSSTAVIQEVVPVKFDVGTDNTASSQMNYKVEPETLLQSANNNNKDIIERTTNNEPSLPQLSSTADLSIQKTFFDKQNINKQKAPHTKESVLKELNYTVVNEGERTKVDLINHTTTSYSNIKDKMIPVESATRSDVINKSFDQLTIKTSTENSLNSVKFNESTLVSKNIDITIGNNTKLSEAETSQTRNKQGLSTVGLVKTAPIQTSDIVKIVPVTADKTPSPVTYIYNSKKDQAPNYEAVLMATQTLKLQPIVGGDNTVSNSSGTENKNGVQNTYSSIVSSKDVHQNGNKASEARVKSLAERDVMSNKLPTTQVESTQNINNNAGEAFNLALFDLLLSAKSGGFEENNNKPSSKKPHDEQTTASGNEGENSKINTDSIFTTLSSESVSKTTESVEVDNNKNYNNNKIDQSNSKYEPLTSKPTIEISTRPTQVDNLKNIQLPIVSEVSTQSTVRSTSQKLSLENNTPLPATTIAITNNFVCKFNQRGRFADNHDCRKFYICHGRPQPLEGICPVYTVFSELRKQCTKNLSHCVRNNQFQCVSEGRFSDFLNDNIYYICVKNKLSTFIRFKLRCQNGYHLNKTSVRCVLNTESSQSISISVDISKSNSEQSAALKLEVKDSKSKDSSKNKFECKEQGTFADPDNCRVYYVCKKTSKSKYLRKKKKCDSDDYFHKDKKKCVDAESYECK